MATETVVLSDPKIIGINIEPWVDGSSAMTSCQMRLETQQEHLVCETYRLSPCPVSGHYIAVPSLLAIKLLICHVVNVTINVRIGQDILDDLTRVPMPNIILHGLPLRDASCSGERTFVLEATVFPLNVAKLDCIDLLVKILVIGDGWRVVVGNECGHPEFEEFVDLLLREFGVGRNELCKFEANPRYER